MPKPGFSTPPDPQARPITWAELHETARTLAAALRGRGPDRGAWRGIVAVARGGLIPSAIIAYELGCRDLQTIAIATYANRHRGTPAIIQAPTLTDGGAGFLVIDDLVDTGTTLRAVQALYPAACYACLYAKPAGRPLVSHAVVETAQQTWIAFPWDAPDPP